MLKWPDENVSNLLNAIVLQAVKDYRRSWARLKKYPYDEKAEQLKKDAEDFFLSDDFSAYTSVDGERVLNILKKESETKYGFC